MPQTDGVHDYWDIEAVISPPTPVGPVLRAGAASIVMAALDDDQDIECNHYEVVEEEDRAGVVLIGAADGDDHETVRDRAALVLDALIAGTPELSGWRPLVASRPALDDDEEVDLDEEAARLVPDGDELAERLVQDIAHEKSVYDATARFAALSAEELSAADLDALDERGREAALRRATALAGCLIHASELVVDHLFEDVAALDEAAEAEELADIRDTWVLSSLPDRFETRYSPLFARMFLVALVDVTARFTAGWKPLACVAQELGLRVLLDHVELVAETADVALDEGWRGHLEGLLFEDLDHEVLYDPALDGIEDEPEPGTASMRFEDWFTPFNDDLTLPPYALAEEA